MRDFYIKLTIRTKYFYRWQTHVMTAETAQIAVARAKRLASASIPNNKWVNVKSVKILDTSSNLLFTKD